MQTAQEGVAEVLQLIASKDAQVEYHRNVPIADVPSELLCMWFDDLGEVWRSDAFSSTERDQLESFHAFYRSRSKQLPEVLDELHRSPAWNEIMAEAQRTLGELAWPRGS